MQCYIAQAASLAAAPDDPDNTKQPSLPLLGCDVLTGAVLRCPITDDMHVVTDSACAKKIGPLWQNRRNTANTLFKL